MSATTRVGAALAAGYVLGRFKKLRLALVVGSALANKNVRTQGLGLLQQGAGRLTSSPEGKQLGEQISGQLMSAGKAAAVTLASSGIDRLSDRLHERGEELRGGARQQDGGDGEDLPEDEADQERDDQDRDDQDRDDQDRDDQDREQGPDDEAEDRSDEEPEDEADEEPEDEADDRSDEEPEDEADEEPEDEADEEPEDEADEEPDDRSDEEPDDRSDEEPEDEADEEPEDEADEEPEDEADEEPAGPSGGRSRSRRRSASPAGGGR